MKESGGIAGKIIRSLSVIWICIKIILVDSKDRNINAIRFILQKTEGEKTHD